jgi:ketose-bisphosphate aldolase
VSSTVPVVDLVEQAHRERWAVGQFNMSSLDTLHGIIDAANAAQVPAMVGLSLTTLRYVGLEYIAGLLPAARTQADVPLYFHLDHGASLDDARQVVAAGFDSVMIDTSMLPYHDNVARVREVVAFARDHGVGVEAQIGETWEEDPGAGEEAVTDPTMVAEFVHASGIDYLACSFGNKPAGGVGIGTPDLDLFARIGEASPVPLVVHGGTSLTDDMVRFAIGHGAAKVNIDTWIRRAVTQTLARCYAGDDYAADPRLPFKQVRAAVAAAVGEKLRLFTESRKCVTKARSAG